LKSAVVLVAVGFVTAASVSAQINKPRPSPGERLRAPVKITAAQEPGGLIRVVWTSVYGAAGYEMIRSAPPTPAAPIQLPNPKDTFYIDRDIKPPTSYYYQVDAISEAGAPGMKISAPPVTVTAVSPPAAVRADLEKAGNARISWSSPDPGWKFFLERSVSAPENPGAWVQLDQERDCCIAIDPLPQLGDATRVLYRVRARDQWGNVSTATMSNEISPPPPVAPGTDGPPGPTDSTGGNAKPAG
jgi:hypothetical protein